MKILLVEDDAAIASGIEYSLQQEGFVVRKASCVKEAYTLWMMLICIFLI